MFTGDVGYGKLEVFFTPISFEGLEPGDIILGGYPGCSYGRFSHAGIYMGDEKVIEAYVDLGITIQSIFHYWDYKEICLLKVNAEREKKEAAVEYLEDMIGRLFYPTAFKPGDRIWNCSKIIWKAYYQQGIDLDDSGDFWVSPDMFYNTTFTTVIREANS